MDVDVVLIVTPKRNEVAQVFRESVGSKWNLPPAVGGATGGAVNWAGRG